MVAYKERAPGVYRAKFVKLDTDYKLTDRDSGEEVTRWRWVFQETADSTTIGELDTVTSVGFKSRSNGLKLFSGMLGRAPTEADDTDEQVGKVFDVVYGPNQNGRNTVTGVLRVGDPAQASTVAPVSAEDPPLQPVAVGQVTSEDLPF